MRACREATKAMAKGRRRRAAMIKDEEEEEEEEKGTNEGTVEWRMVGDRRQMADSGLRVVGFASRLGKGRPRGAITSSLLPWLVRGRQEGPGETCD